MLFRWKGIAIDAESTSPIAKGSWPRVLGHKAFHGPGSQNHPVFTLLPRLQSFLVALVNVFGVRSSSLIARYLVHGNPLLRVRARNSAQLEAGYVLQSSLSGVKAGTHQL